MENIYLRYKPIFIPVSVLVIALFLELFVGKSLWSRYSRVRLNLNEVNSTIDVFEKRLTKLRLASEEAPVYSSSAQLALPSKNSALAVVSQLRNIAFENELNIENLSLEGQLEGEGSTLSRFDLSFKLNGEFDRISAFLSELPKLLPLVNITTLDVNDRNDLVEAKIEVVSFWARLPTELPPITEPVIELSQDELATLNVISSFKKPLTSTEEQEVSLPGGVRLNPFTF